MAKKTKRRGRSAEFMRSINPHLKKRKIFKHKHSINPMAKKRRSHSKRSSSFNLWGTIAGVGGVIIWESLISPRIPINEPIKSLGELVFGVYLSKKGGIVGNVGKALVIVNAYHLMSMYVSPLISNVTGMGVASGMPYY